jgi:hypothetical protein
MKKTLAISALIILALFVFFTHIIHKVDAADFDVPNVQSNSVLFTTALDKPPVILIQEDATNVCYSDDYFRTYTRVAVSSAGTYGPKIFGNGKDCAAYIEGLDGARTVHYTLDYGASWSTTSGGYKSIHTCFSDGGQYIIVGANNNAEGAGDARFYKASTNSGGAWYTLPTDSGIFDQDQYAGFYAAISRDGKYSIVGCRNNGYGYNTNYLDQDDWVRSKSYNNEATGAPAIAPDNSGWLYAMAALNYQVAYNFSMSFQNPSDWDSSATNIPGRSYAFSNGTVGWCDYSTNKHYRDSGSGISLVESLDLALWTDDKHSFEVETREGDATLRVSDVSTGKTAADWYECIFVSRDGKILVIADDGELYYSEDQGKTWKHRTGTMNITTSSRMMVQQYNRSW